MNNRMGSIVTMSLIAVMLAGFGYWQFAGVSLARGESGEHEHESEAGERYESAAPIADRDALIQRIVAQYGGRVTDVERERERGRTVYEVKLVDADGRQRELLVDPESGKLLREGD